MVIKSLAITQVMFILNQGKKTRMLIRTLFMVFQKANIFLNVFSILLIDGEIATVKIIFELKGLYRKQVSFMCLRSLTFVRQQ